ncbi:DUF6583 family protein [Alkaliphilus serpentinus]|uniref:Lipoprotein n=1 Tax=Alkaliphilus serpentinus TaxID=1482731 RepID=A0A833HPH2_9FIRM|nr:DUF6583 family protein [Alkaliphilus serpentinus]KAB3530749.1 hypothetical protein F8153_06470 [Alkaliphilus serpentinus]
MKKTRIMSILLIVLLASAMILGGCSKPSRSAKEMLTDVIQKQTEIKTSQGSMELTLNVNMDGLDVTSLNDPNAVAILNMINNLKVDFNYTSDLDQQKHAIEFNADMGGMAFYGEMYMYDEKLAIHMPFLTQFLGDPRLSDGYLVMDLKEMAEMQGSTMDMTNIEETQKIAVKLFNTVIDKLGENALTKNGSSTIEIGGESVKVEEIQLNIGMEEMKTLALGVVDLLEDKDFRDLVFEMVKSGDPLMTREEFEEELNAMDPQEAKDAIDQGFQEMAEVVDFAKSGLKTKMYVDKNDYTVRSTMEMTIAVTEGEESFDVTFNVTSDAWNINKPVTIEIPEINEENSIDVFELLYGF